MWWRRNKTNKPQQPETEQLDNIEDMTSEEHMVAGENVMACRDWANIFMALIADHRDDGHECLPYCIPGALHEELQTLDPFELKMVLTVVLKDIYDAYLMSNLRELWSGSGEQ